MIDSRNNGFSPRPMVKGNWVCSECGKEITQLPFEPREDRLDTLKCIDCHRASKPARNGHSSNQNRPMIQGSWTCSNCGKEITQLPFEPKEGRPIQCSDCFRASRPARDERRW